MLPLQYKKLLKHWTWNSAAHKSLETHTSYQLEQDAEPKLKAYTEQK